jgi:phosphatidylethanolamine-binding protein
MSQVDPLSSLISALKRENIIPDVIPEDFYPTQLLTIKWPNGKEIVLGDTLTVEDTIDEPSIQIAPMAIPAIAADSSGEPGENGGEPTYTIVLTDPDAPSRTEPIYREFRHWVVRTC